MVERSLDVSYLNFFVIQAYRGQTRDFDETSAKLI